MRRRPSFLGDAGTRSLPASEHNTTNGDIIAWIDAMRETADAAPGFACHEQIRDRYEARPGRAGMVDGAGLEAQLVERVVRLMK